MLPVVNNHWQQNKMEHFMQFPSSSGDLRPDLIQNHVILDNLHVGEERKSGQLSFAQATIN